MKPQKRREKILGNTVNGTLMREALADVARELLALEKKMRPQKRVTPAMLGIKPGQPIELCNEADLLLELTGWELDCRYRILIGVLIQDCVNVTVQGGTVRNAANQPDPTSREMEVGHGFQGNRGHGVRFDRCTSLYIPADGQPRIEDHFNMIGVKNGVINMCRASGPTTRSGTGFCIDVGCTNWQLFNSTGDFLGPTGITVCSGPGIIGGLAISGTTDACARFRSIEYGYPPIDPYVVIKSWKLTPRAGRRVDLEDGQERAIKFPFGDAGGVL